MVSREAQNATRQTLAYYRGKLYPFILWCDDNGAALLDAVTADHVRQYLVTLQRRDLAPYTVHGAARAIKAFLRFCAADGLISTAPAFQMPKLPKKILPALDPVDVRRLLDVCENDRDRLIVLMLLDTGLRASEFVALDGGDIDDHSGAVIVQDGKGHKGRTVYLGAKTKRELARYWRKVGRPAARMPVWCSLTTGERLTADGLRQLLARLGHAANVQPCNPHTFRRTFALWSLRSGMSIYHLQRLMGHEDITVLRQYLALVETDLAGAQAKHSAVDRML